MSEVKCEVSFGGLLVLFVGSVFFFNFENFPHLLGGGKKLRHCVFW